MSEWPLWQVVVVGVNAVVFFLVVASCEACVAVATFLLIVAANNEQRGWLGLHDGALGCAHI
ncbi:hypothetical protein SAMN06265222_107143 [Neorhodopirellula lusitana]|uniref:Uncharacterized protein n=1 Tax=Neorhodopirellula lusitana TaxID=445327 RepID=A0ABY1Q7Z0_9BACT|nr:hypothetical protein SAMN06265222_107143 [Neorhodopirellula lusitana]